MGRKKKVIKEEEEGGFNWEEILHHQTPTFDQGGWCVKEWL